ncbi:ketosteroid isomerase-like protein [Bradyrhizobium sp. AZCC 2262]|uniref:nuclear transport factor 2 family protein n=1 Tax=Bradyrhizobium sp. AZCC 2262 TaxID=3117022 RepID=UPI002FF065F0
MSEYENRQFVEQAYAAFKAGDIPTLLQSLSEDVTWKLPEIENVPFAGERQGRGAVGEFFSTLASLQHARSFEEREFIAQGDKVVVLGHYVCRSKPTGAPSTATSRTSSPSAAVGSWPSTSTWTQPRSPKRIVRVLEP